MEITPVKNDREYPQAASEGSDNAFYIPGCQVVQHSPSYAACLFKIKETTAGRLQNVSNPACIDNIQFGGCHAAKMKTQETEKGKALFYLPRQALQLRPTGSRMGLSDRPFVSIDKFATKKPEAPVAKEPASILSRIDKGSYADALNVGIKASASTAVASTSLPRPRYSKDDLQSLAEPGETLIQTAQRLLNELKG